MGLRSATLDTVRRAAGLFSAVRAAAKQRGVSVTWAGRPVVRIARGNKVILLPWSHLIYVPDVVSEFDMIFNAVASVSEGDKLIVDYSRPRVHRIQGTDLDLMMTSFTEGLAGVDMYFRHVALKPGDVVLDLGANCGLFAIACAKRVGPSGTVIAVEPDPATFAALRDNVHRSGATNVRVVHAAIWSAPGKVRFAADSSLGSLVLRDRQNPRGRVVETTATTIDGLAREVDASKIALVKVDIEGAEYDAFLGARELLSRGTATWLTEVHFDESSRRVAPERIERFFDDRHYKVSRVQQGSLHAYPLVVAEPRDSV